MKRLFNFLRKRLLLIVILILIIGGIYYAVTNSKNSTSSTKTVTANVTVGSVSQTVSSVGNLQAANQQIGNFSSNSTANVIEIDVKPGDVVKIGQVLAKIDDTDLQNKKLSADVSLQTAKNNLSNTLIKGKYTDYDILNLKQNIKIAQSNYDVAVKNLNSATLTATVNGIVAAQTFTVSQTAGTNSIIVYDPDSLYLNVTFTEYDLALLQKGATANITFNSLSGKTYIGKLSDIAFNPTITSNVVTYGGKIAILANDGSLKLGFSGTAVVVLAAKDNVLAIPTAAIRSSNGQNYVNLLVNGQQQRQDIEVGIIGDTMTEVTKGLSAGQTIVVSVTTAATSSNSGTGSALQLLGGNGGGFNQGGFTRGTGSTGGGTTRSGTGN